MNGLKGVRVLVVDDSEDEALPILKAFAKKGIPTAFFDGSIEDLPPPEERLTGVRLAILDMDLVGGGAPDKSKAAALVKLLVRILSPDNGPYAVIAWTKHPELRDLFESSLFSNKEIPGPIFSVMITKGECLQDDQCDMSLLATRLEQAMSQAIPLLFLQAWEEKCFNAATEVTNALSSLAVGTSTNHDEWRTEWRSNLLQLMHAMAQAEMEKNLDCNTCFDGLYGSLNPLHADRMESHSARLSSSLESNSNEILSASADCSTTQIAKVNTMLHLAFEHLERFSPGNIYVFTTKKKPDWVPSNSELVEDMAEAKNKKDIGRVSTRMIVEASAICDHAQGNIRIARFISGLLVPASERKKMKGKAGFLWAFGPVFLEPPIAKKGEYYFYLSARHGITLKLNQLVDLTAVARLRTQAFSDLQAWYSHHSARPGMMMLREK